MCMCVLFSRKNFLILVFSPKETQPPDLHFAACKHLNYSLSQTELVTHLTQQLHIPLTIFSFLPNGDATLPVVQIWNVEETFVIYLYPYIHLLIKYGWFYL